MNESKMWTVLYGLARVMRGAVGMVKWSWLLLIVGAVTWVFHMYMPDGRDGMPSWVAGLGAGALVAVLTLFFVAVASDKWSKMKPSPPPEFIQKRTRRKAAKDKDVSGGLSQASTTGGEVSMVEGGES